MSPDVRAATPVAHQPADGGSGGNYTPDAMDYSSFYTTVGGETVPKIQIDRMFDQRYDGGGSVCPGLHLGVTSAQTWEKGTDPPESRLDVDEDLLDLHAVTDGFLSYADGRLVLRLPRELEHVTVSGPRNSGELLYPVPPRGPNLRYVVYDLGVGGLSEADEAAVESRIGDLVGDTEHPMHDVLRIHYGDDDGDDTTVDLGEYLSETATGAEAVVEGFMDGRLSLLVEAGDVVGNFADGGQVVVEFRDSCGAYQPEATYDAGTGEQPPAVLGQPRGRRLNPAYFLWSLFSEESSDDVDVLTAIPEGTTYDPHPLFELLSAGNVAAYGADVSPPEYGYAALDLSADDPPVPRQYTVPVPGHGERGIPVAALSEWHESRNNSDPYDTDAPIKWRVYGDGEGDADDASVGQLWMQTKSGADLDVLPDTSGPVIPSTSPGHFAPTEDHRDHVTDYWENYGSFYNAVADALDVPCELLVAITCKETAGYDTGVVVCEPMRVQVIDHDNREIDGTVQDTFGVHAHELTAADEQNATNLGVDEYYRPVRVHLGRLVSAGGIDLDVELRRPDGNVVASETGVAAADGNGEYTIDYDLPDAERQLAGDWTVRLTNNGSDPVRAWYTITYRDLTALTNDADERRQLSLYENYVLQGGRRNLNHLPYDWDDGDDFVTDYFSDDQLPMTYEEFTEITAKYRHGAVKLPVTPGMMQTQIVDAELRVPWIQKIYGDDVVSELPPVTVTVDGSDYDVSPGSFPDDNDQDTRRVNIFQDWYGVEYGDDSLPDDVYDELTRLRRVYHSIIAGAAHVRMMYNYSNNDSNTQTDFDPPTVASGYNDQARSLSRARMHYSNDAKWRRLFGLLFYGAYGKNYSGYYNAAVELFNGQLSATPDPEPAVRFWRSIA